MSYKEELKDEIASISSPSVTPHEISKILHSLYTRALEESKKTGQSVSSITYEILEGIEESHSHHIENIETQLSHASVIIALIIYKSAQSNIEEKEKKLQQTKDKLIDTIELEIVHLLESIETFEHYAEDKSHTQFQQSLYKTKSDILNNIDAFKALHKEYSTS